MPHRYICDVLEDIRNCDKTKNYGHLTALIEEAQTYANRMEKQLWEYEDLADTAVKLYELKEEKKKIESFNS